MVCANAARPRLSRFPGHDECRSGAARRHLLDFARRPGRALIAHRALWVQRNAATGDGCGRRRLLESRDLTRHRRSGWGRFGRAGRLGLRVGTGALWIKRIILEGRIVRMLRRLLVSLAHKHEHEDDDDDERQEQGTETVLALEPLVEGIVVGHRW